MTNQAGVVVETMAYDPWGKRRFPNGTNDRLDALYGVNTDRGYTMHEHLDEMGIIHMNGRVFDPLIGRFMSADPHIQFANNLQSYNRYSYVLNNPLSYTDPSGYFLRKLFRTVIKIFSPVIAHLPPQVASVLINVASLSCGAAWAPACAGAGQAALAYYHGASTSDAFKVGARSAATAWLFQQAGNVGGRDGANTLGRYLAHAGAGCISSVAGGGKCGQGAASAVFGKFTSNQIAGIGGDSLGADIGRGVATAVAGGVGSVIGGGKFANGAETAAYGYLFNELMHQTTKAQRGYGSKSPSWGDTKEMWQNGNDSTLVVDIDTLNFHGLENDASWKSGAIRQFAFHNGADFAIYGTVDIYKIDSQTFRVMDKTYNNEQLRRNGTISRDVRNGLTRLNEVLHGSWH